MVDTQNVADFVEHVEDVIEELFPATEEFRPNTAVGKFPVLSAMKG